MEGGKAAEEEFEEGEEVEATVEEEGKQLGRKQWRSRGSRR